MKDALQDPMKCYVSFSIGAVLFFCKTQKVIQEQGDTIIF